MIRVKFLLGNVMLIGILMMSTMAVAQEDTITADSKVKFDYTLKVEGEIVESSIGSEPLEYIHGNGVMIPGLEKALEGLKVGDEINVVIEPDEAYGEVNEEAYKEIEKQSFPDQSAIQKGMVIEIEIEGEDGGIIPGIIWEVKDETVIVNFNHPLAGKILEFDVTVVEIEQLAGN